MEFSDYIGDVLRRNKLAEHLGRNPSYLWQIGTKRRRASTDLAREIEAATAKLGPEVVPKESLRPDVWPRANAA